VVFFALPAAAFADTGAIATFTKMTSGSDSDNCSVDDIVAVLGGSGDASIRLTGTAPWTYVLEDAGTAYTTGTTYFVDLTSCGASTDSSITVDTVSSGGGGGTTPSAQDEQNVYNAFIVFFVAFFGVIWLLRKH